MALQKHSSPFPPASCFQLPFAIVVQLVALGFGVAEIVVLAEIVVPAEIENFDFFETEVMPALTQAVLLVLIMDSKVVDERKKFEVLHAA